MKAFETLIGLAFLFAAFVFLMSGYDLGVVSAVHQIYQMMYFICAVLCSGFGFLMIKSNQCYRKPTVD